MARAARALVVGRFQPLHKGHEALIEQALDEAEAVTVVLGSSQAGNTPENPFTAAERTEMLRAAFGERIDIAWVPDIFDPPNWVAHVQGIAGGFDKVYGNDPATLDLFHAAGAAVARPGLVARALWEGATIRTLMAAGDPAWRDAVPDPVGLVLENIQGVKRIQELARQHGR